jgi:hypothetical protein
LIKRRRLRASTCLKFKILDKETAFLIIQIRTVNYDDSLYFGIAKFDCGIIKSLKFEVFPRNPETHYLRVRNFYVFNSTLVYDDQNENNMFIYDINRERALTLKKSIHYEHPSLYHGDIRIVDNKMLCFPETYDLYYSMKRIISVDLTSSIFEEIENSTRGKME